MKLRELLGLERHLWNEVPGAGRTPAIKFRLSAAQQKNWQQGASLVSAHPHYPAQRPLTATELAELAADFD